MNITFEKQKASEVDISKPTIMKHNVHGYLVLTTGTNTELHAVAGDKVTFTGMVVVGGTTYPFGHFSKCWDLVSFSEHKGILTIDNTGNDTGSI